MLTKIKSKHALGISSKISRKPSVHLPTSSHELTYDRGYIKFTCYRVVQRLKNQVGFNYFHTIPVWLKGDTPSHRGRNACTRCIMQNKGTLTYKDRYNLSFAYTHTDSESHTGIVVLALLFIDYPTRECFSFRVLGLHKSWNLLKYCASYLEWLMFN